RAPRTDAIARVCPLPDRVAGSPSVKETTCDENSYYGHPDADPPDRGAHDRPGPALLDRQRPDSAPYPHAARNCAGALALGAGRLGPARWRAPRVGGAGDRLGPDRPDLGR